MDTQYLPPPPIHVPLLQGNYVSAPWSLWFTQRLYPRVGGALGTTVSASEVTFDPSGSSLVSTNVQDALVEIDASKQPLDATLTALAGLGASAGFIVQTAADTFTKRTITANSAHIVVTNGDGALDNPSLELAIANAAPGTFGNQSTVPQITVDGYGRATSASAIPIRLAIYSAGVVTLPTITPVGDGTFTVGNNGIVNLYPTDTAQGILEQYQLTGGSFTPTDGTDSYLYADYNAGSPRYVLTSTRSDVVSHKLMDRTIIATVVRNGTALDIKTWDQTGLALAEKALNRRFDVDVRFSASLSVGGPMISDTGSNRFALSAGRLWDPIQYYDIPAFASQTDSCTLLSVATGTWSATAVTGYNITQYNDTSGLQTLSNNKYAVNWIWENVSTTAKQVWVILGGGDYTLAEAQASLSPAPPSWLPKIAVLVGRIIVKKSAATATQIDSAFTKNFGTAATIIHNDTSERDAAACHPMASISNNDGTLASIFTDTYAWQGFVSRTDNTVTLSTRTVTVAPTGTDFGVYMAGVKYLKTGGATCQTTIPNTVGLHFIYFDANLQLQNSMTPWSIVANQMPVATIFWNGSAGALYEERHAAGRDLRWHEWAHDTIGTRYQSGLARVYPDASHSQLSLGSGSIHDEDIDYAIPAQTTIRNFYETAAATWTWANGTNNAGYDRPYIWNSSTSRVRYPKTTSAYALTDAGANEYIVVWAYATLTNDRPIMIVTAAKSAPYANLNDARTATPPSTAGLLTPEMKLIYRWIFKGDGTFQEEVDYRNASTLPAGGTPTIQHNDTLNKQGGASGEYYHLTSAQNSQVALLNGTAAKTLSWQNTMTLAGTDGTSMTFPATNATIARTDAAQTFTGENIFSNTSGTSSNFRGYSVDVTSSNSSALNGQITLGSTASYQGRISYGGAKSSEEHIYYSNTYDSTGRGHVFKVRTAGTPITVLTLVDTYAQLGSGARLLVDNTTDATTTNDGSLQTDGGLSVAKNGVFGGDVNVVSTKVYKVNGTQVVGARGAAVADATGTGDIVAQFNTLLSRLRAHGLIAT